MLVSCEQIYFCSLLLLLVFIAELLCSSTNIYTHTYTNISSFCIHLNTEFSCIGHMLPGKLFLFEYIISQYFWLVVTIKLSKKLINFAQIKTNGKRNDDNDNNKHIEHGYGMKKSIRRERV